MNKVNGGLPKLPKNKRPRKKREIDVLTRDVEDFWDKTFVFIQKTRIKTWKGVFIIAFVAGALAAVIWTVSVNIQTSSKAAGEAATLSLTADNNSVGIGETFNVDINLQDNRSDYGVVAVKAIVNYDTAYMELQSVDVDSYSFGGDANSNSCQYNGKACQIVDDTVAGQLEVTVAKPHPGVQNSDSIQVARIIFKAIKATANTSPSLKYTAAGNYDDSDVILDDGLGTDILSEVVPLSIAINAPACTFTFNNDWQNCSYDATAQDYFETQTYSKSPDGCSGEPTPDQLRRTCTHPTCSNVTPGTWSQCTVDPNQTSDPTKGTQSRDVTGDKPLCTMTDAQKAANPTTQQCNLPTCTYTCGDWGTCAIDTDKDKDGNTKNGIQTRDCGQPKEGTNYCYGAPTNTQFCTVDASATACTGVTYQNWNDVPCLPDANSSDPMKIGKQTRTFTGTPDGCVPTSTQLQDVTQTCTAPTCTYSYSDWEDYCHSDLTQHRTVTQSPAFCQGTPDVIVQHCDKEGKIGNDNNNSHKKAKKKSKKSSDKTAPTLNIPLFLTKNKGDKVWWSGFDKSGIKNYTWSFAGRQGTTKTTYINIPNNVGSGIHFLMLRAYDKAGNHTLKIVTIRVR